MNLNENFRNEIIRRKIKSEIKITHISVANCPRLPNRVQNQRLDSVFNMIPSGVLL